jgi:hypothetical protein
LDRFRDFFIALLDDQRLNFSQSVLDVLNLELSIILFVKGGG